MVERCARSARSGGWQATAATKARCLSFLIARIANKRRWRDEDDRGWRLWRLGLSFDDVWWTILKEEPELEHCPACLRTVKEGDKVQMSFTIDTIYRYIWIYIRCKKMRGRPSTRVASSCAPCSTSPAQEMSDHCKTCHEHIVGKYAPAKTVKCFQHWVVCFMHLATFKQIRKTRKE